MASKTRSRILQPFFFLIKNDIWPKCDLEPLVKHCTEYEGSLGGRSLDPPINIHIFPQLLLLLINHSST